MTSENIAAISTALAASGVAVIRISGDSPLEIARKMFFPTGKTAVQDFEPYKMYPGEIRADNFSDFGLCVYFKAPKSFTGEDVVEFHTHGGVAITKGVLNKAIALGARLAERGEFTKRAFLNGKLSLSSAEGLIDMINAETESGAKAGYYLYREKLNAEITRLQDMLTAAISETEADIDFPEEDLEVSSRETVIKTLDEILPSMRKIAATFVKGRIAKNGVRVGIVGKPNTGKSSLLNAIQGYDKAIVSSAAGTTRDIVEGERVINGVKFYFSDTAGIRECADGVESIGVELSRKTAKLSDLIFFVVDGNNVTEEDRKIYSLVKDGNTIIVSNKSDLGGEYLKADIKISAKDGSGIEELMSLAYNKTVGTGIDLNGDFLCEERHYDAVKRAIAFLENARGAAEIMPLDLIAVDLKSAWDALGEISGKTASEEIINDIFSRFCVGK